MTDFYVRPAGGSYGAEDGSSYADAWDGFASVVYGAGAGQVGPFDTLYVCGTHSEQLDLTGRGDVIVAGDYFEEAGVIDGYAGDPIYVHGGSARVTVRDITVQNSTGAGRVYVLGANHIVDNVTKNGCTGGIRAGSSGANAGGVIIKNCTVTNCANTGIFVINATGAIVEDCLVEDCGTTGAGNNHDGIAVDNDCDNAIVRRCIVRRQKSGQGAGIDMQDSTGGNASTVERCLVEDSETHGFSTVGNASYVVESCVVSGSGQGGFYPHSSTGSSSDFYNCVASDNNAANFKVGDGVDQNVALTIRNCITEDSVNQGFFIQNSGGSITESNNCFNEADLFGAGESFTPDATDLLVDPALDENYTPTNPLLFGAAVKWWGTDPRPVGYDGEPFPDVNIDIGAIQGTSSLTHPANL